MACTGRGFRYAPPAPVMPDVIQKKIFYMESERNKKIAISVLQGMTYDNVGIKYNISRERVYQITKMVLKQIDSEIDKDYNINELRKVCNRLIYKISNIDC